MSSNHKLVLIKSILYTSDYVTDDEKLDAIRHLIHGWDKEPQTDIESQKSWLNDLSVETRNIVKALSDD